MSTPASSSPLLRRIWDDDTFSSLTIMGIRVGMLAAKFLLSIFIARYMGLEDLGIYGLIVGAAATLQTVLRGGIFSLLSRDAVHQSLSELTHHLRHYGLGVTALYLILVPVSLAIGWYFDEPALGMLALAVFFTEHLTFDSFVLINNLQYPKLANLIYSLQSASWIYLFVILAFFNPSLRSLDHVLIFWVGGGVIALSIVAWLSRGWPWKKAFMTKLEWDWYPRKIRNSVKLYFADVIGVVNYYLDRYIVTLFLSLEMTGIYVFFSQVVTATWNLINSGVMVVYRPRLIKIYDSEDLGPFNKTFKECLKRTFISTFALAVLVGLTVPHMAKFTDNADILGHIPLLWVMLMALMFRIGETSAGGGLFAMHKDREYFIFNIIVFLLTLLIGSLGVIAFGVYGIVLSTFVVAVISILYVRAVWKRKPASVSGTEERYA